MVLIGDLRLSRIHRLPANYVSADNLVNYWQQWQPCRNIDENISTN